MEFTVSKEQLNQGLSQVSRLATSRMPLPILNNILLSTDEGRLVLSVTDLELGIQTSVPAESTEHGSFTVPARLLHEFVQATVDSKLIGKVKDNASLDLSSDHGQVRIRGLDASEFPNLPFTQDPPTFTMKASILKEALDLVGYAAAIDDTRPVLAGVLLRVEEQELVVVATDSYRLAEKRVKLSEPVSKPCSAIVPKRTISELSRLLGQESGDISVFVGDNQIQCMTKQTKVVSRLIEGNYPQYQTIIPNEYRTRVTAHLADFTASLKTAQLFARDAGNTIKIQAIPGQGMMIEATSSQQGESKNQFTAITEGEELQAAFNVKFLLDALVVVQADNIFLEFNGPDRAVVIRPANSKEYMSLVMPLRV